MNLWFSAWGSLDVNYGIKKIWGQDRCHQRKLDELNKNLAKLFVKEQKAQQCTQEQTAKVMQSSERGHGRLLEKRINKLEKVRQHQQTIETQIEALHRKKQQMGQPGQKADRDFRKQTIMIFRTVWLENQLRKFIISISDGFEEKLGIETTLELLFYRDAYMECSKNEGIYRFDSIELSEKYRSALQKLIAGINTISLHSKGKRVRAFLEGFT